MNKRVSAAEALEMSAEIKEFISTGPPSSSKQANSSQQTENKIPKSANENNSLASNEAAADITTRPRQSSKRPRPLPETEYRATPHKPAKKRIQKKRLPQPQLPDATPLSHSKARVQKTVRFLPQLITEVDAYLKAQAPGQERSFQDIANEALREWLDSNTTR